MDTRLDGRPLQGSMMLLAGAALYTVLLFEAINLQVAMRQPAFLQSWLADAQVRFWTWDQLTHTAAVLLPSLPCAWALALLFSRRLLPAALLLVMPSVAWMGLDYLSLREELLDAPAAVNFFYAVDLLKVLLTLPVLTLLLKRG
jgi:hypothetical protein